MKNEIKKHSLTDVSFLIPIRFDSIARLENALAAVDYLHQHFITRIIALDAAPNPNTIFTTLTKGKVEYIHFEDHDAVYHKTLYTNMLATNVTTPFISVWDADVIVESAQILDAVDKLRQGIAYMAYPYDGRLLDTSDAIRDLYMRNPSIELLKRYQLYMKKLYGNTAAGAAVFLNLKKWRQIGMDDVRLYGWGNEDGERYHRFQQCDFPIYRSPGVLFHLTHPRDINGQFRSIYQRHITSERLFKTINTHFSATIADSVSEALKQFDSYCIMISNDHSNKNNLNLDDIIPISIKQTESISLKIDPNISQKNLSPFEIQNFSAHHTAWRRFMQSDARWCLIIESNVELKDNVETFLDPIADLPDDWDIFFPYTKEDARKFYQKETEDKNTKQKFIFGNSIYFLSRKGAAKLVTIDIIKDRLDHTLLTMNNLNRYMEQVPWFSLEQVEAYEWADRKEVKPTTDCP